MDRIDSSIQQVTALNDALKRGEAVKLGDMIAANRMIREGLREQARDHRREQEARREAARREAREQAWRKALDTGNVEAVRQLKPSEFAEVFGVREDGSLYGPLGFLDDYDVAADGRGNVIQILDEDYGYRRWVHEDDGYVVI